MKKYITIGIIVVLVLLFGTSGCSTYNKMVVLDQSVQQQWAKVEVQYQRRMDLIPNMVETVKGYAAHKVPRQQAAIPAMPPTSPATMMPSRHSTAHSASM